MKPSFHERVWDLQQRKQGAERLKMKLQMVRIWEKIALNSTYGKLGDQLLYVPPDTSNYAVQMIERRFARARELEALVYQFRPF